MSNSTVSGISADEAIVLGVCDAVWPILLVVEVYYLVPALGWTVSARQLTIGTSSLLLATAGTLAWCTIAVLDYVLIIGGVAHNLQARRIAEGVIIMTGILFVFLSLLNIILFWVEVIAASGAPQRVFNVGRSAFWLRVIAAVYIIITAAIIVLYLFGIGGGITLGLILSILVFAVAGASLIVIGWRLRCVMAHNMAADLGSARRTQATVSVLQIMAGSGCVAYALLALTSAALQILELRAAIFIFLTRVLLACVAAVVTYAVGVSSTTPDSALPPASSAHKTAPQSKDLAHSNPDAAHKAPGVARSAAVRPVVPGMEGTESSLMDADDMKTSSSQRGESTTKHEAQASDDFRGLSLRPAGLHINTKVSSFRSRGEGPAHSGEAVVTVPSSSHRAAGASS